MWTTNLLRGVQNVALPRMKWEMICLKEGRVPKNYPQSRRQWWNQRSCGSRKSEVWQSKVTQSSCPTTVNSSNTAWNWSIDSLLSGSPPLMSENFRTRKERIQDKANELTKGRKVTLRILKGYDATGHYIMEDSE